MFFFQAEDGIRDLVRSRGLGDVYKRQVRDRSGRRCDGSRGDNSGWGDATSASPERGGVYPCLLYTSDAADERSSVDLGGRRIIKKKNTCTLEWLSYCNKNGKTSDTDTITQQIH
mgnify:CR=1 FL=1